jgi:1,5-anhydro-D-fructose reductase (1,5-anhydro-D-mannitol-forming)
MADRLPRRYSGLSMETINWIVAGVGDIARKRVIPAILAERRSSLYGLVTRDPAKAEAYPGVGAWATIEEAL